MTNTSNINESLNKLINEPYKYGFSTDIESESFPRGLTENIIRMISEKKEEPAFMLEFRLKAFARWKSLKPPHRA